MSNDMTPLDFNNLPAEWADIFSTDDADDLLAGAGGGFASISVKGSKWRVKQSGEDVLLTNEEGDASPTIEVVLVKARANVSKTYYAEQYVEGSDAEPDCRSIDGVKPDAESPHPQSDTCATCPHNAWGSRITENGSRAKACSDYRRVAVWLRRPVPQEVDDTEPMLLRIPAATLAELRAYGSKLKGKGVPYRAVITRMSFDPDVAYPKLKFRALRPITADEAEVVAEMLRGDKVASILDTHEPTVAPDPATANAREVIDPAPDTTVVNTHPTPQPETQDDLFPDEPPAPKPASKKKTAKKTASKKKTAKKPDLDVVEGGKQDAPAGEVVESTLSSIMDELNDL